jgi:hypothetical protein
MPLSSIAQGLGLVEAAVLASRLPTALTIEPPPVELLRGGISRLEALATTDPTALDGFDSRDGQSRQSLLRQAARALAADDDVLRGRIRQLIEALTTEPPSVGSQDVDASRMVRHLSVEAPQAARAPYTVTDLERPAPRFDVDLEPVELPEVSVLQVAVDRPDLTVSIVGASADDNLWLRVFKGGVRRPVLLALAPFKASRFGPCVATALLPADVETVDLRADITVDPAQAWQLPTTRRRRAAVTTGRQAARLERRGDGEAAEARWIACSARWHELDDERRAALARSYASTADRRFIGSLPPRPEFEPFVMDTLPDR